MEGWDTIENPKSISQIYYQSRLAMNSIRTAIFTLNCNFCQEIWFICKSIWNMQICVTQRNWESFLWWQSFEKGSYQLFWFSTFLSIQCSSAHWFHAQLVVLSMILGMKMLLWARYIFTFQHINSRTKSYENKEQIQYEWGSRCNRALLRAHIKPDAAFPRAEVAGTNLPNASRGAYSSQKQVALGVVQWTLVSIAIKVQLCGSCHRLLIAWSVWCYTRIPRFISTLWRFRDRCTFGFITCTRCSSGCL